MLMTFSKLFFNLIFCTLLICVNKLYSQTQTFQKNILIDSCNSAIPSGLCSTRNGGIAICGTANAPTKKDICLVKMLHDGTSAWINRISFDGNSTGADIICTLDGNLVLLGQTDSNLVLIKFDSSGNIHWAKKYNGLSVDASISFCQTNDGGFGIAGNSFDPNTGQSLNIIRTDSTGLMLWNKLMYLNQESFTYSISQTIDNGFILTGETLGGILLCKINLSGNIQWARSYSWFTGTVTGFKVKQNTDGNFYLVGEIDQSVNVTNGLILKTDSMGNIIWTKFCHHQIITSLYDITLFDSNIYATGRAWVGNNGNDALLICMDSSGLFHWARTYGTTDYEYANGCTILNDGFALSASYSGGTSFAVIKTDSMGFSGCNEDSTFFLIDTVELNITDLNVTSYSFTGSMNIFPTPYLGGALNYVCQPNQIESIEGKLVRICPNPTNDYITIELPERYSIVKVVISNALGQEVKKEIYLNTSRIELDIKGVSGIYFLKISTGEITEIYKILKF